MHKCSKPAQLVLDRFALKRSTAMSRLWLDKQRKLVGCDKGAGGLLNPMQGRVNVYGSQLPNDRSGSTGDDK